MEILPVSNTSRSTSGVITDVLERKFPASRPVFFSTKKSFKEYLIYETPELVIINFADKPQFKLDLLNDIYKDKWLNSAGIIGIHNEKEEEFLAKVKFANIIGAVHVNEIEHRLPRILKIVQKNRAILMQRALQSTFTGELIGTFEIDNDLLDVNVHMNLLVNFVYNSNYVDMQGKMNLKLVLQEMCINAVEHGNCGISFEEKSRVMMEGISMTDIIRKKAEEDDDIKKRKVRVKYKITNDGTDVTIIDEGDGFDWKLKFAGKEEELKVVNGLPLLHGRGIDLTRDLCHSVEYNEKGNEVHLKFSHNNVAGEIVPGFFEEGSRTEFKAGESVFNYGEESNFLYYIASGKYEVRDEKGAPLATLSPNDIFLGEMSFLLYNIRTAAVVAIEDGILHRISKKNFVSAIKKYPYYSLMLCKILAKRLENVNQLLSDKN